MRFDHIGWITNQPRLFDKFWCKILGFVLLQEKSITQEQCFTLFGIDSPGLSRKYAHSELGCIEVHTFDVDIPLRHIRFQDIGLNHLCLVTGPLGSRERFLDGLPSDITRHVYHNPNGWDTVFIRDYEGTWLEIREGD